MNANHSEQWRLALDAVLHDADTLADELCAACIGVTVKPEATARLAEHLAAGRHLAAVPVAAVPELLVTMLTTEDPAVVMAAREKLRQWYFALKSERIARMVWDEQDREECGPIEAFKAWRDREAA